MDLFIFLGLIIINPYAKCYTFQDYSSFAEDLNEQFFLDENEDTNLTSDAEDDFLLNFEPVTNNFKEEQVPINFTTVDESYPTSQFPKKGEEEDNEKKDKVENKTEGFRNPNFNHHSSQITPTTDEVNSEKILLDRLSKIHRSNYEGNLQSQDIDFNPPPIRREISKWEASQEFLENDMPWNYDVYYPREKYNQNEYSDYSNSQIDVAQQKNVSFQEQENVMKELSSRIEPPQYYQKNYYYNYYPLVKGRKYINGRKWKGDGEIGSEELSKKRILNNQRYIRKSSCKQYLEFLKYAFEKLDESSDYHYDYGDSYNDDDGLWREKVIPKIHRVFTTHMLGPTLYVDNSGKVSQVNSKESSLQNFEKGSQITKILTATEASLKESKIRRTSPIVFNHDKHNNIEISTKPSAFGFDDHRRHTTMYSKPRTTFKPVVETARPSPPLETFDDHFQTNSYPETKYNSNHGRSEPHRTKGYSDNKYGTNNKVDLEENQTHFDEYDYELKATTHTKTTLPPHWFLPEEYYRRHGSGMERTTENYPVTNRSFNNKTAVSSFDWFRHAPTSPATTIPWRHSISKFESDTVLPFDDSAYESSKKEDADCNDKMLPCPDTFNITYPLNGYCNRYVSCESGRAIRRTCPEGLHFNIITKSCDLPHNSFCAYVCPQPNGYYGIPGDCGGYFICKNSIPEYRMCPPRMHWDIQKGLCTFTELSSCPMKCPRTNEVKHYNGDCKAYVICLNGIPYYHKCPPSTKFDEGVLTCVPEHLSKCENDPRLITKTLNPNHMCRDIEVKLGSKIWCNYFEQPGRQETQY